MHLTRPPPAPTHLWRIPETASRDTESRSPGPAKRCGQKPGCSQRTNQSRPHLGGRSRPLPPPWPVVSISLCPRCQALTPALAPAALPGVRAWPCSHLACTPAGPANTLSPGASPLRVLASEPGTQGSDSDDSRARRFINAYHKVTPWSSERAGKAPPAPPHLCSLCVPS